MDAATREFVRRRADDRCEYCGLRQEHTSLTHHVEHIRAKQYGGSDDPDNLAIACHRCNLHKGPNLSGVDHETGQVMPLFHPRRDQWDDHFVWEEARIVGISPVGRATVDVMNMNDARRVELRTEVLKRGR